MDYSDRHLASVDLGLINPSRPGGDEMIGLNVSFSLSGRKENTNGPVVHVEFAIPGNSSMTFDQVNEQALELAHKVIQRVAQFKADEVKKAAFPDLTFDFSKG